MVKLKASTIIETIVAMLIVAICFEIGAVSISRIVISYQGTNKIKALFIAEKELNEVITNKTFFDKEKKNEDYIINRTIKNYKDYNNLKIIRIEIKLANNITLITKQRLYVLDE